MIIVDTDDIIVMKGKLNIEYEFYEATTCASVDGDDIAVVLEEHGGRDVRITVEFL